MMMMMMMMVMVMIHDHDHYTNPTQANAYQALHTAAQADQNPNHTTPQGGRETTPQP